MPSRPYCSRPHIYVPGPRSNGPPPRPLVWSSPWGGHGLRFLIEWLVLRRGAPAGQQASHQHWFLCFPLFLNHPPEGSWPQISHRMACFTLRCSSRPGSQPPTLISVFSIVSQWGAFIFIVFSYSIENSIDFQCYFNKSYWFSHTTPTPPHTHRGGGGVYTIPGGWGVGTIWTWHIYMYTGRIGSMCPSRGVLGIGSMCPSRCQK